MEEKEIEIQLLEKQLFGLFCSQLQKDFQTAGLDADPFSLHHLSPATARATVLENVVKLSRNNSEGLRRLLYRVDISEKQLDKFHRAHKALSFEEVVAELIVRRVLQKVIIRKKFSGE